MVVGAREGNGVGAWHDTLGSRAVMIKSEPAHHKADTCRTAIFLCGGVKTLFFFSFFRQSNASEMSRERFINHLQALSKISKAATLMLRAKASHSFRFQP